MQSAGGRLGKGEQEQGTVRATVARAAELVFRCVAGLGIAWNAGGISRVSSSGLGEAATARSFSTATSSLFPVRLREHDSSVARRNPLCEPTDSGNVSGSLPGRLVLPVFDLCDPTDEWVVVHRHFRWRGDK